VKGETVVDEVLTRVWVMCFWCGILLPESSLHKHQTILRITLFWVLHGE